MCPDIGSSADRCGAIKLFVATAGIRSYAFRFSDCADIVVVLRESELQVRGSNARFFLCASSFRIDPRTSRCGFGIAIRRSCSGPLTCDWNLITKHSIPITRR